MFSITHPPVWCGFDSLGQFAGKALSGPSALGLAAIRALSPVEESFQHAGKSFLAFENTEARARENQVAKIWASQAPWQLGLERESPYHRHHRSSSRRSSEERRKRTSCDAGACDMLWQRVDTAGATAWRGRNAVQSHRPELSPFNISPVSVWRNAHPPEVSKTIQPLRMLKNSQGNEEPRHTCRDGFAGRSVQQVMCHAQPLVDPLGI